MLCLLLRVSFYFRACGDDAYNKAYQMGCQLDITNEITLKLLGDPYIRNPFQITDNC